MWLRPDIALGVLVGVVVPILVMLIRLSFVVGGIVLKVNTLWWFHVRRGRVEMLEKGWGAVGSDIHITASGLAVVMPFLDVFLPFYAKLVAKNPKITDAELAYEIEHEFGDFIMEKMCLPNGVSHGACLVSIITVCRMKTAEEKK